MRFDKYIPCDILKPYISLIAVSELDAERSYKVLPGTGLVIGFQYKGKLSQIKDDKEIQLSASGLTGLHDSYRIFKNSANIGSILVYFRTAGASNFFRQPIHEIFRESISLDNFMLGSELLILEDQLCSAQTDAKRINIVEKFLIGRMLNTKADTLVLAALALIHQKKGNIRIKELAEQLNISQSPLEKRFRKVAGASPKKFASIVRFRNTLQSFTAQASFTELGHQAGFYDQAHFIKEFRNFTGETPETFFSGKTE